MKKEERDIMADMFYFLREFGDPPSPGTEESTPFWEKASDSIASVVGKKWQNHPLAMQVGITLYNYIVDKSKGVVV